MYAAAAIYKKSKKKGIPTVAPKATN